MLQQHLPFSVLKRESSTEPLRIKPSLQQHLPFTVCAAECEAAEERSDDEAHTLQVPERSEGKTKVIKQQSLLFTVCAEGCEIAEERSDDEAHTLLT